MFIRWLGEGADRPSESVTIAQVRKFREFLEEGGRSLRTFHYYLADVGSAFRAAVREGLLTHNSVSTLEARTGEPEVKRKPFEVEEVRALLAAVPSTEWKGVILLGAFAGLRLGDATSLQWQDVNLAKGTITLIPSKTKRKGRVLTVPMHPDVRAFLAKRKQRDEESGAIFPTLVRMAVKGRNGLSRQFGAIMDEAGVARNITPERKTDEKSGSGSKHRHKLPERSFHSLRHTFTSWLANADAPPSCA